jgi:hypothetical protein
MADFEPTAEELQHLGEMLKKEEFRKLLAEYAEEISNPEQRQVPTILLVRLESALFSDPVSQKVARKTRRKSGRWKHSRATTLPSSTPR